MIRVIPEAVPIPVSYQKQYQKHFAPTKRP